MENKENTDNKAIPPIIPFFPFFMPQLFLMWHEDGMFEAMETLAKENNIDVNLKVIKDGAKEFDKFMRSIDLEKVIKRQEDKLKELKENAQPHTEYKSKDNENK